MLLFNWPGRLSKAHKDKEKEKEKEKEREKEHRRREKESRSNGDAVKHKSSERDGGKDERKRKHRESSQDRYFFLGQMFKIFYTFTAVQFLICMYFLIFCCCFLSKHSVYFFPMFPV